jgi:hypothetical protein
MVAMVARAMRHARQRRQHMDRRGVVRQELVCVVFGGGCEMKAKRLECWR